MSEQSSLENGDSPASDIIIARNRALSGRLFVNREGNKFTEMYRNKEAQPAFQKLDAMRAMSDPQVDNLEGEHNRLMEAVAKASGQQPFYDRAVEALDKFRREKLGVDAL